MPLKIRVKSPLEGDDQQQDARPTPDGTTLAERAKLRGRRVRLKLRDEGDEEAGSAASSSTTTASTRRRAAAGPRVKRDGRAKRSANTQKKRSQPVPRVKKRARDDSDSESEGSELSFARSSSSSEESSPSLDSDDSFESLREEPRGSTQIRLTARQRRMTDEGQQHDSQLWAMPMDAGGSSSRSTGRKEKTAEEIALQQERGQQRKEAQRLQTLQEERQVIQRLLQGTQTEGAAQAHHAQEASHQQARARRWVAFPSQRVGEPTSSTGDSPSDFGDVLRTRRSLRNGRPNVTVQLLPQRRGGSAEEFPGIQRWGSKRPRITDAEPCSVEGCPATSVYSCSKTNRRLCSSLDCYKRNLAQNSG
jgi:hypothetical protein